MQNYSKIWSENLFRISIFRLKTDPNEISNVKKKSRALKKI